MRRVQRAKIRWTLHWLFSALRTQFRLRLAPETLPMELLVTDHAERIPAANAILAPPESPRSS
jgi:uncharacterized protein (TIGR03435 family)